MDDSKPADPRRRNFIENAGIPFAAAAITPSLLGLSSRAALPSVGTSYVETISQLRMLPTPAHFMMIMVSGHHRANDGGGGLFCWDPTYLPQYIADDGGTYILPSGHAEGKAGRWRRIFDGALNAHWFGALGDNTGRTPEDDGLDITAASWNIWPSYLTSHPANTPKYFGFHTETMPFSNTDSWDWIGIQLALFSVGERSGEVLVGAGVYQLTKTLFFSNGMHATLSGAGLYQTTLTKKSGCFDHSTILYLYRIGGVPTLIRGFNFSGPYGGGTTDFHLITQVNTNGVHFENCWLTTCNVGIYFIDNCGDNSVTHCSAEYCETVLSLDMNPENYHNDGGSDLHVEGCNFWQSAGGQHYTGIAVKGGTLHCVGSRFIGFNGASIMATIVTNRDGKSYAPTLLLSGNNFLGFNALSAALSGDGRSWVVSGNRFVGAAASFVASIPDRSSFTGNYIESTNNHACLNINHGAMHTTVSGNTFINSSGEAPFEGALVISAKPGVNYSTGCSHCVVVGNSCGAIPTTKTSAVLIDAGAESGNIIANNGTIE